MGISCFRRKGCRLCASDQVVLASQFVPTPPGDMYVKKEKLNNKEETFPIDLFLCTVCGNIQLLDVVSPETIYENYIYRTENSSGLSKYFQDYAQDVLAFIAPEPGALIVDIGSNNGPLLRCFKGHGYKILGVDPSPIAQTANKSGIETFQTFFSTALAREIRLKKGDPQLVTANNVSCQY